MTDRQQPDPPEVLEAYWNREQVAALFADLAVGAVVRHVQIRTESGRLRPEEAAVTLEQARDRLDRGQAKAVQIHYDYDGQSWCDTLLPQSDSIHIIRTRVPPRT